MIFLAVILAALAVFLIQRRVFSHHFFDGLKYRVRMSTEEVFEGEDIYLFEELENKKYLPLPSARVETELPDGLSFRIHDKKGNPVLTKSVSSVFVIHGGEKVSRRWRVKCGRRGVYHPIGALIVSSDLFGSTTDSQRISIEADAINTVTVLPKAIDIARMFTSSSEQDGDRIVPRGLLTDPTRICGTREYVSGDPMNRVNWLSTAVHGQLMVNNEEHTEKDCFNIVLNMQSHPFELHDGIPSNSDAVELGISVCATILDMLADDSLPVRFFANVPTDTLDDFRDPDYTGGETDFLATREYRGRDDTIEGLRMLASLPMRFSCRCEKFLDVLADDPDRFTRGGNLIFVSPYLDDRMLLFHEVVSKYGVRVIFYVTGTNRNALIIPPDVEVYYRTYGGGETA